MEKILQQMNEQQRRTNLLLEVQSKLLKKQFDHIEVICHFLEKILLQQQQIAGILQQELVSLLDQPLLDKNKVMDKLNIKESTYRRYVANGYLCPIRFEKIDWYFERDIVQAMEKSRLKGRV